ncbi:MAG: hypothetical protein JSV79_12995 [Armatimonadota bacterium]|nr:MAG: hypothetical protein JSV79_12995 [Armatimonadota bacterium]
MREHNGRKRANPTRSTPSAVQPAGYRTGLVDCRVCRAPNGGHREGCFNCGSLLQLGHEHPLPEREQLAMGDANLPGRVVYVAR